jgi:hypothetical protein
LLCRSKRATAIKLDGNRCAIKHRKENNGFYWLKQMNKCDAPAIAPEQELQITGG